MTLFLIAFLAGVLTVLAPCVLPLLPIIVGGSVSGGVNRARAVTVALSLGVSVILFTLLLKSSTLFIDIPQYAYERFSGGILIIFGLITLFPQIWDPLPVVNRLNRNSNRLVASGYQLHSFWGDVLVGAALGPVFSTCSPTYFVILATVLPASFAVGLLDLLAYTIGLVLMLLVVALVGQRLVDKLGLAADPRGWFKRTIGALFIVVGVIIFVGYEQPLEAWLISHVYDITKLEQNLLERRAQSAKNPLLCSDGTCKDASSTSGVVGDAKKAMQFDRAPELASIDGYINTDGTPITISEFKGKRVVLIDFWTYSCINCQRTLPYLRDWYDTYHDQGLEIIGVHTPEFAFEHVLRNVQNAVTGFGLKYPVVLDNEYSTWRAFGNQYWPRKYLIDIDGYIVFDHAGEGNYDETERAIQTALQERAQRLGMAMPPAPAASLSGVISVDETKLGSGETYFGALRNEYLGNGIAGKSGVQIFTEPDTVRKNALYLIGSWSIMPEYAETPPGVGSSSVGSDRIDYRYQAKSVYIVAGSKTGKDIEVEVLRDSEPLNAASAGKDIIFKDGRSYVRINENRLYTIVNDTVYGDHLLEFIISDPGLQVYTFTFG
ncbi:redoxin family protein [Candidatus Kaiserbacteria bacterium]|nr:redoxin family protein [Candidatus Kaiserbacteria bacterium]